MTSELPRVILRSTSVTGNLVFPSITTSFGVIENPLPKEVIPTDCNVANGSIRIDCGKSNLGFKVLSEGRLNPISSIETDFKLPIVELCASKIAPSPETLLSVEIPGKA